MKKIILYKLMVDLIAFLAIDGIGAALKFNHQLAGW